MSVITIAEPFSAEDVQRLVALDQAISAGELNALRARHEFGRRILPLRTAADRLPDNYMRQLAQAVGRSAGEINTRMRFANRTPEDGVQEVYRVFGSWRDIVRLWVPGPVIKLSTGDVDVTGMSPAQVKQLRDDAAASSSRRTGQTLTEAVSGELPPDNAPRWDTQPEAAHPAGPEGEVITVQRDADSAAIDAAINASDAEPGRNQQNDAAVSLVDFFAQELRRSAAELRDRQLTTEERDGYRERVDEAVRIATEAIDTLREAQLTAPAARSRSAT